MTITPVPPTERHPLQTVAIDHWEPDAAVLGYLPRITCKACREASKKLCADHSRIKCPKCRNNITSAHIDLDYVGHADVNRALTMIDAEWDWEPTGWTEDGQPVITVRGAKTLVMWGRLTLLGKSRLCVGSCEVGKEEADKELVGDLIRNGAMRHNVYGSLWSKAEGASFVDETPVGVAATGTAVDQVTVVHNVPVNGGQIITPAPTNGHAGTPSTVDDRRAIKALAAELSETQQLDLRSWCVDRDIAITLTGQVPQSTTVEQLTDIRDYILTMEDDAIQEDAAYAAQDAADDAAVSS